LVWRTVPSDSLQASALDQLVTDLEAEVRIEQSLAPTDAVRVAMVSKSDAFGTGLSDAMLEKLTFNGKNALDNGKNFLQKVYPETASEGFDFSSIVSELTGFAPHIVLLVGTQEIVDGVLAKVEASWPVGTPRPRHLLTAWGRAPQTLTLIGADDELRKRILGTAPGRRTKNFDAFALRYSGVFGSPPDTFGTANAYDAVYVLTYGMAAAAGNLTGERIAQGIAHELGGTPIDVGPNKINAAIGQLSGASNIELTGASGALDFDLQTGDAPSEIDVWCVTRNEDLAPIFTSSGRYWDPVTQKLVGTISCP
jgi:branched-chain amino acid transport system substrate-binding protein